MPDPDRAYQLEPFELEFLEKLAAVALEPKYPTHTTKDGWTVTIHFEGGLQLRLPWEQAKRVVRMLAEGSPE